MKFAIAGEHRDYFHKQHAIEFDALLTPKQILECDVSVSQALADRLQISGYQIGSRTTEQLFPAGRDLWRQNQGVRKIVFLPRLAEIAYELIETKPLRLGIDQVFFGADQSPIEWIGESPYRKLLSKTHTLSEIVCLQGILCGLMICLSAPEKAQEVQTDSLGMEPLEPQLNEELCPINIFSEIPGNGVYFDPNAPIDFSILKQRAGFRYLLVTYVQANSVYIMEERDINVHYLKGQGLVFGDKLNEKLHPVLYR